jgi:hypothetical protein
LEVGEIGLGDLVYHKLLQGINLLLLSVRDELNKTGIVVSSDPIEGFVDEVEKFLGENS